MCFHRVTYKGAPIVKGKRVTGFTNDEEGEVHLTNVVPFLVEDELKRLGGIFEKVSNWQPFAIIDGRLITGQNPASSTVAAQALLSLSLRKKPLRFLLQLTNAKGSSSSSIYAGRGEIIPALAAPLPTLAEKHSECLGVPRG